MIFQRAMSRPKQLAAVSSNRSASRLSPIQDRSSRRTSTNAPISNSKTDGEIIQVERKRHAADLDIVVERPAEDVHALDLHALRAAEHVIDLEEGLEQQREGDRHHRGIMPTRAQHRQQQQRADQRGQQPADQQHDKMRHGRIGIEHRRGIGADAEERRARKIEHAGIAELNVQPECRHAVEQHGDDKQQREMILVKECRRARAQRQWQRCPWRPRYRRTSGSHHRIDQTRRRRPQRRCQARAAK